MIPSIPSGLCGGWGFLVLAPVSCGIAHGWHRRQGPQRLMIDSKTRWQLWNNNPGRDQGNSGLGAIQNPLFDFPSLMETQWKENAAGYPQWHSSGMKPFAIQTSQSQLQSGQLNNAEQWVPQPVKFAWQGNQNGQDGFIHLLNESRKSWGVFEGLKVLTAFF